jgi:glycosyltransferase involved in cell wall biosynthesis
VGTIEFGELNYPHALYSGGPGMRILFLAPRYPYPARRGDQVRAFHLVKHLSRRAELTLLSFGDGEPLPFDGVNSISIAESAPARIRANLARPNPALPLQARLYLNRAMRDAVATELSRGPDVVHVTLARMGSYMPAGRAGLHRHIDLVDSLAHNMATRAAAMRQPGRGVFMAEAALMRRYEARLVAEAESASVVSAADLDAEPSIATASVVPMGIDTESIAFHPPPETAPPVLAFFGNLGYFHNVEPARFLATEVLPLVRRQAPDAELRLIGARPARPVRELAVLEGVRLLPDVPDMAEALRSCTVAALPMFSGSGLKNKVLEALACGLPVVSNELGMQGVDGAASGSHFVGAETAAEMAKAALRLFGHPAERARLAGAGRELVEQRYSWASQVDLLMALYRRAGSQDGL